MPPPSQTYGIPNTRHCRRPCSLDSAARPISEGQYGKNGKAGSGGGVEKSLRETVRQVLLSDVVRMDGGGNGAKGGAGGEAWRVMVLDGRATRVISSVVGMYDIMEGHVTVVEDLHKVNIHFSPLLLWFSVSEICVMRYAMALPAVFSRVDLDAAGDALPGFTRDIIVWPFGLSCYTAVVLCLSLPLSPTPVVLAGRGSKPRLANLSLSMAICLCVDDDSSTQDTHTSLHPTAVRV